MGASRRIQDIISATRNQIKADFEISRILIAAICDEVLLLHQSRIKRLNIVVRKSIPEPLYLNGSASLLSHILTNLISNAIDALEEKRNAAINPAIDQHNADMTDSPLTLEIYASKQSDHIKIMVRDNGIGIPEAIRQSVFDPFFTTKKHTGWGYGLSATKHIVEKHFSGSIRIDSDTKNSLKTSFVLTLPFEKQKNAR
jgi:signal transduction histidine kinase